MASSSPPSTPSPSSPNEERLNKFLARCGVASRRGADKLITQGRVAVNGHATSAVGTRVGPNDCVTLDGEPLTPRQTLRVWRYHKPAGQITTHVDTKDRLTVFDAIQGQNPKLPRLISVGRLDYQTEGLLLLTNAGTLAHHLELPSNKWTRRYRVRAFGAPPANFLSSLNKGVTIEGIHYGAVTIKEDKRQGNNTWYTVCLQEGKNREIRRLFDHFGLMVNRLIRTAYGPFQLGNLPKGTIEEIPPRILRDQLGGLVPSNPSSR